MLLTCYLLLLVKTLRTFQATPVMMCHGICIWGLRVRVPLIEYARPNRLGPAHIEVVSPQFQSQSVIVAQPLTS